MKRAWLPGVALLASLLGACDALKPSGAPGDPPDARASPQAKAVPAPLANVPAPTNSGLTVAPNPDAGPPPVPLRGDRGLPPDSVGARELVGYTLQAVLRASDIAGGPRAPEISTAGIDAAKKKTEPRLTVDMAPSRTRIVLSSAGFVLPQDTELRARVDRYGHVLVWPGPPSYRIAAPGTLRALLGERRLDVAPLGPADVALRGESARRLGLRTRKVEVVTRAANASFEIAHVADVGEGGVLLCRALLDLVNAPPSTPLCTSDEVPLHAELRWTTRGSIVFDATSLTRRTDLSPTLLATPPMNAAFMPSPPDTTPGEVVLSAAELAAFRTTAIDVPLPDGGAEGADKALVLQNATDELRFAWLDGSPIAWISPGGRVRVNGLTRGRYIVQWRTFLGDSVEPPQPLIVPGKSTVGDSDGGAGGVN